MLLRSDWSRIELSVSLSSFFGCSYSNVWWFRANLTLCLGLFSSFTKLSFLRILFFRHSSYFSYNFRHFTYGISLPTDMAYSLGYPFLSFYFCRFSSRIFSPWAIYLLLCRLGVVMLLLLSLRFRMEIILPSLSSLLGIYSQWIIYSIWNILFVAELTVFKSTS